MKLILSMLVVIPSLYTFSFAGFSWREKNRTAAVGAVLFSLASIVLPVIMIWRR